MNPWLFALMGLPGAGKSTLAEELAGRIPLHIVSRDEIRVRQFPLSGYSASEKAQLNSETFRQAEQALRTGWHVLVDGLPFSRVTERDALAQVALRCDARFQMILLDCPLALAESRITSSSHPAADRTVVRVREVAARFEPCGPEVWRLDAQRPTPVLADELELRFRVGSGRSVKVRRGPAGS